MHRDPEKREKKTFFHLSILRKSEINLVKYLPPLYFYSQDAEFAFFKAIRLSIYSQSK